MHVCTQRRMCHSIRVTGVIPGSSLRTAAVGYMSRTIVGQDCGKELGGREKGIHLGRTDDVMGRPR